MKNRAGLRNRKGFCKPFWTGFLFLRVHKGLNFHFYATLHWICYPPKSFKNYFPWPKPKVSCFKLGFLQIKSFAKTVDQKHCSKVKGKFGEGQQLFGKGFLSEENILMREMSASSNAQFSSLLWTALQLIHPILQVLKHVEGSEHPDRSLSVLALTLVVLSCLGFCLQPPQDLLLSLLHAQLFPAQHARQAAVSVCCFLSLGFWVHGKYLAVGKAKDTEI